MAALTYDQFVTYVRSALHYLYDPVHLRSSPLIALLKLTQEFDKAAALQQALTQAIRALKPAEDEPPQSRAWRIYDALHFQYVRQLTREEVAVQLGISERQLRREQRMALEVLAQQLWPQLEPAMPQLLVPPEAPASRPSTEPDQALSEELIWLKKNAPEPPLPLGAVLHTVHSLVQPLAQQWQAPLEIDVQPGLAELPVSPLALRSILLTVLSVAIPQAEQRPVQLGVKRVDAMLELNVTCQPKHAGQPFAEKDVASLEMAQNLAVFYGAQLALAGQMAERFAVTLTLPAPEQTPVLVIDDNPDWLELLQRYAASSGYQVIGAREPETARSLAEKVQPTVILLDVMMHNVDGWQILNELRNSPTLHQTPIVICTVLPVEELALSLGANAFLQKPVTQQQFLQILAQQSMA